MVKMDVIITDEFWKHYRTLVKNTVLPYQWSVMNDNASITITKEREDNRIPSEKSHAVANFYIAAGKRAGHHYGYVFQDTDVYKWLEALSYMISHEKDSSLREVGDCLIDLIAEAQQPDGYLVTYFIIEAPERRFKRLKQSHELYSMGHYIEAGIAYYKAVGNKKALDIAVRMADCIVKSFGPGSGQIHGYDGHPEIELALAKLYEVTDDSRYLNMADYFLKERGKDTGFFDRQIQLDGKNRDLIPGMEIFPLSYYQADRPVTEQNTAEGHAVRLVYLCTGMAHVARLTGDEKLKKACKRLWENIVKKRMYITGGIGSTHIGESFTYDYDLPNDTMYCETCAAVGMTFFARRMLEVEQKSEYADVLEKELFNATISGISLDGQHFFYVNPLETNPGVEKKDPGKTHVMPTRKNWFGCACCPANLARLITSINQYIYVIDEKRSIIYSHQFIANKTIFDGYITIEQKSHFPWESDIQYVIENPQCRKFIFAVRIPSWSKNNYQFIKNGIKVNPNLQNGFAIFDIKNEKMNLTLCLDMRVHEIRANNHVRDNTGKVAVQRGPLIYCMEEADNKAPLNLYHLRADSYFKDIYISDLLEGITIIETLAYLQAEEPTDAPLYTDKKEDKGENTMIRLIPYYSWGNRNVGEMQVWMRKDL